MRKINRIFALISELLGNISKRWEHFTNLLSCRKFFRWKAEIIPQRRKFVHFSWIFFHLNYEIYQFFLINWINFYFYWTFFLNALYQILQNNAILINCESFFQEKESTQLYRSQFLEINSLMDGTIKNQVSTKKFYSFWKIGNGQVVENLFPAKMIRDLSESHYFWKFGIKRWEKKFRWN